MKCFRKRDFGLGGDKPLMVDSCSEGETAILFVYLSHFNRNKNNQKFNKNIVGVGGDLQSIFKSTS